MLKKPQSGVITLNADGFRETHMHAARLEHSPRLQRLLAVLRSGREYSTRDLVKLAEVMAINSAVDELREGGFDIECERRGKYWYYRLAQPVQLELVA